MSVAMSSKAEVSSKAPSKSPAVSAKRIRTQSMASASEKNQLRSIRLSDAAFANRLVGKYGWSPSGKQRGSMVHRQASNQAGRAATTAMFHFHLFRQNINPIIQLNMRLYNMLQMQERRRQLETRQSQKANNARGEVPVSKGEIRRSKDEARVKPVSNEQRTNPLNARHYVPGEAITADLLKEVIAQSQIFTPNTRSRNESSETIIRKLTYPIQKIAVRAVSVIGYRGLLPRSNPQLEPEAGPRASHAAAGNPGLPQSRTSRPMVQLLNRYEQIHIAGLPAERRIRIETDTQRIFFRPRQLVTTVVSRPLRAGETSGSAGRENTIRPVVRAGNPGTVSVDAETAQRRLMTRRTAPQPGLSEVHAGWSSTPGLRRTAQAVSVVYPNLARYPAASMFYLTGESGFGQKQKVLQNMALIVRSMETERRNITHVDERLQSVVRIRGQHHLSEWLERYVRTRTMAHRELSKPLNGDSLKQRILLRENRSRSQLLSFLDSNHETSLQNGNVRRIYSKLETATRPHVFVTRRLYGKTSQLVVVNGQLREVLSQVSSNRQLLQKALINNSVSGLRRLKQDPFGYAVKSLLSVRPNGEPASQAPLRAGLLKQTYMFGPEQRELALSRLGLLLPQIQQQQVNRWEKGGQVLRMQHRRGSRQEDEIARTAVRLHLFTPIAKYMNHPILLEKVNSTLRKFTYPMEYMARSRTRFGREWQMMLSRRSYEVERSSHRHEQINNVRLPANQSVQAKAETETRRIFGNTPQTNTAAVFRMVAARKMGALYTNIYADSIRRRTLPDHSGAAAAGTKMSRRTGIPVLRHIEGKLARIYRSPDSTYKNTLVRPLTLHFTGADPSFADRLAERLRTPFVRLEQVQVRNQTFDRRVERQVQVRSQTFDRRVERQVQLRNQTLDRRVERQVQLHSQTFDRRVERQVQQRNQTLNRIVERQVQQRNQMLDRRVELHSQMLDRRVERQMQVRSQTFNRIVERQVQLRSQTLDRRVERQEQLRNQTLNRIVERQEQLRNQMLERRVERLVQVRNQMLDRRVERQVQVRTQTLDRRVERQVQVRNQTLDRRVERQVQLHSQTLNRRVERQVQQRNQTLDRRVERQVQLRSQTLDRRIEHQVQQRNQTLDRRVERQVQLRSQTLDRRVERQVQLHNQTLDRRVERQVQLQSQTLDRRVERQVQVHNQMLDRRVERQVQLRNQTLERRVERQVQVHNQTLDRRVERQVQQQSQTLDRQVERQVQQRSQTLNRIVERQVKQRNQTLERRIERRVQLHNQMLNHRVEHLYPQPTAASQGQGRQRRISYVTAVARPVELVRPAGAAQPPVHRKPPAAELLQQAVRFAAAQAPLARRRAAQSQAASGVSRPPLIRLQRIAQQTAHPAAIMPLVQPSKAAEATIGNSRRVIAEPNLQLVNRQTRAVAANAVLPGQRAVQAVPLDVAVKSANAKQAQDPMLQSLQQAVKTVETNLLQAKKQWEQPNVNINRITDQVYKEFTRRVRFEQQRRGI
ncbi:hypothetical protein [Paenibacillus thalictri]|uniref:hypothetical protein n=1 Tax=Paenibacillus thalictri TaxID=2527873 RepID=UPI0013EF50D9|nr:hypothetical protein [Paenibacillus thalictri]